jgi:ATP-dependent RNA helicase RhlE
MGNDVTRLSGDILSNPVRIEVTPQATPIAKIEQSVYHIEQRGKRKLLSTILGDPALSRVIIFARTKHRANRVAEQLDSEGVDAEAIHGNKSQGARQRALKRFRSGDARVLVATDIAARGIDVDNVTHVINYELPNEPESYVHRIGRTARAGAGGIALSFCDENERVYLKDIERLIKHRLNVIGDEPAGLGAADGPPKSRGGGHVSHGGNRPPRKKKRNGAGSNGHEVVSAGGGEGRPKHQRQGNKPASFATRSDSSRAPIRRKRAA